MSLSLSAHPQLIAGGLGLETAQFVLRVRATLCSNGKMPLRPICFMVMPTGQRRSRQPARAFKGEV